MHGKGKGKNCDATPRCEATTETTTLSTKRYDVKTVDCVMKLVIRWHTYKHTLTHAHEYINAIELTRCVSIDRMNEQKNEEIM